MLQASVFTIKANTHIIDHICVYAGYTAEELKPNSLLLTEAIELRKKYMKMSRQSFSTDCEHFLQATG